MSHLHTKYILVLFLHVEQSTLPQRKMTQMSYPVATSSSLPGSLGADSSLYLRFECGSSWFPLIPLTTNSRCSLVEQRQDNINKHSHSERGIMEHTWYSLIHSNSASLERCLEPFPGVVEHSLISSLFCSLEELAPQSFVHCDFWLPPPTYPQAVLPTCSLPWLLCSRLWGKTSFGSSYLSVSYWRNFRCHV